MTHSGTEPLPTNLPPIVSIVGRPDCGKTTLLEKVIPELARQGYRVGTIKHHVHEFEMDKPGKDTWRHKQAGARIVALSSPTGLGVIRDTDRDTPVVELVARYFLDADLILAEGYKRESLPKIEVYRTAIHASPLEDRDATWMAMVSDRKVAEDLPYFALDDIQGITSFLVNTFIKPRGEASVSLLADGRNIPLNRFVEGFLRKSVLGMTSALKGCESPKEIVLTIRNE